MLRFLFALLFSERSSARFQLNYTASSIQSFCRIPNMELYQNNVFHVSKNVRSLKHLFTKIRDKNSTRQEFSQFSKRLMSIICEEGLSQIASSAVVTTPTDSIYNGQVVDTSSIVAVSVIRAGDALLESFTSIVPDAAVGKILIQRNEETKTPILFYSKLPPLESKIVILLDPMLATGGSAKTAIEVLISSGATEDNIVFINVVSCPEGITALLSKYPRIRIVTGEIDEGLNENAYIVPGLGDFGDRFYGTVK